MKALKLQSCECHRVKVQKEKFKLAERFRFPFCTSFQASDQDSTSSQPNKFRRRISNLFRLLKKNYNYTQFFVFFAIGDECVQIKILLLRSNSVIY